MHLLDGVVAQYGPVVDGQHLPDQLVPLLQSGKFDTSIDVLEGANMQVCCYLQHLLFSYPFLLSFSVNQMLSLNRMVIPLCMQHWRRCQSQLQCQR
jgi:hypothetical protein